MNCWILRYITTQIRNNWGGQILSRHVLIYWCISWVTIAISTVGPIRTISAVRAIRWIIIYAVCTICEIRTIHAVITIQLVIKCAILTTHAVSVICWVTICAIRAIRPGSIIRTISIINTYYLYWRILECRVIKAWIICWTTLNCTQIRSYCRILLTFWISFGNININIAYP